VEEAEADRSDAAANAERHCRQVISHFACLITAVVGVTETEHAGAVRAQHLSESLSSTAQVWLSTDADGFRAAPDSKRYARKVVGHFVGLVPSGVRVTESELSVAVFAPALDAVVVEQRAGMVGTGSDCLRSAACAKCDRGKTVAELARLSTARAGVPEAELAGIIAAPTLDAVVIEQRARMTTARRNGLGSAARTEVNGCRLSPSTLP